MPRSTGDVFISTAVIDGLKKDMPSDSKIYFATDVQKYGARVTFAKRYAFCNALGILTGDEDIDSKEDDKNEKIPEELITKVKNAKNESLL
jgi:hypothetical protein